MTSAAADPNTRMRRRCTRIRSASAERQRRRRPQEVTMSQSHDADSLSRAARSLALGFALVLTLAAPAWALVASEQQQGAQILGAIHAGKLKGTNLSNSQYEHVGEYLMGQALASIQEHERRNTLMQQMMGSAAVDQMHIYLGERYLGKSAQISGRYAPMYGLIGMMTSYRGSALAGLMSGYQIGRAHV